MFQSVGMMPGLYSTQFWLAQLPAEQGIDTPEDAALVFSGPQFFIALIAGLVLAFAFQLLLTNLSVALGISILGGNQSSTSSEDQESGSLGGTIRKIGFAVGLWTLVTVSIALLIACFLAVNLSLVTDAGLGAIIGLVIWAAYFSLLVWVSSTTVGSLIGSVVNTATSGFQAIVGTAAAAIGGKTASDQIVSTAEAAAAAVRRELSSAVDPTSIRETVEDYLGRLRPPELDLTKIRSRFEELLNDPELKSVIGNTDLRNIDRQTFVDLVSSRTDFSKQDVNRVADLLEGVWKQTVGQPQKDTSAELLSYLRSARPEQLRSNELSAKLDQLIAETRTSRKTNQKQEEQEQGMMGQARQFMISTLMGSVLGRTDLSELDVQEVWNRLKTARDQVTEQTGKLTGTDQASAYSTIRADVENYLANTYSWQMTPEKLEQEFRDVIYDPIADPRLVRQQLEQLSRSDFVKLLQQRGVLTQEQIATIADQCERIRLEILASVRAAEETEKLQAVRMQVEYYLRSTNKAELTSEGIQRNFKPLLEDSEAEYETLSIRLSQFDRSTFVQLLQQRSDLSPTEVDTITNELETTRDRVLVEAQDLQTRLRSESEALQLRVESYLRNTNKAELSPEGIKRDLRTLLDDPQVGTSLLRARLSQFDRDTLVKLLSQRQDLSEAEANQIVAQAESVRDSVLSAPQVLGGKAKDQYDQATNAIADYLRRTNRAELSPEGIKRDLQLLLNDPQAGSYALRRRLSQMDRETLVQLLSQRQDLSEEQVNQIIDQFQEAIRTIVRAPQRWATRAQIQVRDFQATLEDYLRNTNKAELSPEGIKRDLQLLLNDPRLGAESLGDRLSRVDRSTIVALLAQRPDMTEEEANRIVTQIESVREQFVEQVRNIQRRIQSVVDGVFAKIRDYLNSFDRPELNYDGIKRDVRQLFDDPQAGFESLRDRLGQFNRDTLVAVLSSREDISEAQANRIIDQVEGARSGVLQQAERIQQEAQRRIEALKQQAQRQAEETRKAAATAAWWLFGTAAVSGAAAVVGGALAVIG